jgi:toxin ParE1/3/4
MARYRLSDPAEADIATILRSSEQLNGKQARIRYRACLTAAMRRVAADSNGLSTADRADLLPGARSFHARHSRNESRQTPIANPAHVIFYRTVQPDLSKSSACCTSAWSREDISARRRSERSLRAR